MLNTHTHTHVVNESAYTERQQPKWEQPQQQQQQKRKKNFFLYNFKCISVNSFMYYCIINRRKKKELVSDSNLPHRQPQSSLRKKSRIWNDIRRETSFSVRAQTSPLSLSASLYATSVATACYANKQIIAAIKNNLISKKKRERERESEKRKENKWATEKRIKYPFILFISCCCCCCCWCFIPQ